MSTDELDEMPDWCEGFTEDQISMILSCLANRHSLCCKDNFWRALVVANGDRARAEQLASYAYEAWGCCGGVVATAYDRKHLDIYFIKALNDVASATDAVDGSDWPEVTDAPHYYTDPR